MKKTQNINISGYPFVIDEDAFILLSDYLSTITQAFGNNPDALEIISDIESRVAELLLQATSAASPIVTLPDVEKVISRIGQPEEFTDEKANGPQEGTAVNTEETAESEDTKKSGPADNGLYMSKKPYRDPQNAMLGGVCSGLSWYLGIDVTWIRLFYVLVTILSFSTAALVYLILWLVIPPANTPYERMQMMGQKPTMENIAKNIKDNFKDKFGNYWSQSSDMHDDAGKPSTVVGTIARTLLVIACIFIGLPILITFVLGLLGCILSLMIWGTTLFVGDGFPFDFHGVESENTRKLVFWGILCAISWILTIGIPVLLLVRRGLLPSRHLNRPQKSSLTALWIAAFIASGITTGFTVSYSNIVDKEQAAYRRQRVTEYDGYKKAEKHVREMNADKMTCDSIGKPEITI